MTTTKTTKTKTRKSVPTNGFAAPCRQEAATMQAVARIGHDFRGALMMATPACQAVQGDTSMWAAAIGAALGVIHDEDNGLPSIGRLEAFVLSFLEGCGLDPAQALTILMAAARKVNHAIGDDSVQESITEYLVTSEVLES